MLVIDGGIFSSRGIAIIGLVRTLIVCGDASRALMLIHCARKAILMNHPLNTIDRAWMIYCPRVGVHSPS